MPEDSGERWLLLIYRVPAQPSKGRVAVWRDLRRLGAYYPQHAVSVLPDRPGVREELALVRERIEQLDGTAFMAELTNLSEADEQQLVSGYLQAAEAEFAEIAAECTDTFMKKVDFEVFRENFSVEVADTLRQDLVKLRRWYEQAVDRDWMCAPGRATVERLLQDCETRLDEYEVDAFDRRQNAYQDVMGIGTDDEMPDAVGISSPKRGRRTSKKHSPRP